MLKLKEIKVDGYIYQDQLGSFTFNDVTLIVPADASIDPQKFNQEKDEYSISVSEIKRLAKHAAMRFVNTNYSKVLTGQHQLTSEQVYGIALHLDCNGSEVARILNVDKSTIARILNGESKIKNTTASLLMERCKNEIEKPGATKSLLYKLDHEDHACPAQELRQMHIPVFDIAEWFIRRFAQLKEPITNLKLQKLLYYAQGIAIGRYGIKIFDAPIQAFEYGPVVKEVWERYYNKDQPVLSDSSIDVEGSIQDKKLSKILEEIVQTYGSIAPWALVDKTHQESPWVETPRNEEITDEKLINFFSQVLE